MKFTKLAILLLSFISAAFSTQLRLSKKTMDPQGQIVVEHQQLVEGQADQLKRIDQQIINFQNEQQGKENNQNFNNLDDDDYFTTGFLKDMASHTGDAVDVVCGRLVDKKEDGSINADTYINRVLKLLGEGLADDYNKAGSLFTSICVKLIRTDIVKNVFSRIPMHINY